MREMAQDMAGKGRRGGKPGAGRAVTMAAVGRIAGVSQVTVSRALSDPSKVSPETLHRIREAIEITGFVPNALAGALASARSHLISALVPSITNIVYASMIQSFTGQMRAQGYQILMSETGFELAEEEALVAAHLSRRPDALLLTGIHHSPQTRKMLLAARIPVVEVWDITESPIDICVGFNHVESGRIAADFLLDAGYGRFASVSAGDERALRRKDAFAAEIRRRTGNGVAEVNWGGPASLALGREALRRLIGEQGFDGGAIFCSSDLLAQGVMIEAGVQGLVIPDRLAVMGFGDQDYAAHLVPALTTIHVDRAALGAAAARAILSRLDGREDVPAIHDLGFEIIRRQSA